MSITRVAVVYDDSHRPETTGGYCFRALQKLVSVTHVRPGEVDRIDPGSWDLFLRIDDGLPYLLPDTFRPLAWWAIDTHLEFERGLEQACRADLTFAAQRPGADALTAAGVYRTMWLPLACDPSIHRPHAIPKTLDFSFVGNEFPGPRAELLAALRTRYPRHFVGRAFFDEMARAYSSAHTSFNRSIRDDLNMRVFEALACGSFLLTNDLPGTGQDELFQDGVHLGTYRDADELLDKLRFYLANPAARTRAERAGRQAVCDRHTYAHRMAQILESVAARPRSFPARATSESTGGVDPSYFEHARPELLALVPREAREVLDVGCGAGRFGISVKERQPARVTGIETNARAATYARTRLDRVFEGDVEAMPLDTFAPESFDAVVCGDVLEHLRDPLPVLRKLKTWLRPSGVLVASFPNARHHSVVRGLLAGDWSYEPAGLLDHTHLRFFTQREIEKLLFRAGFDSGRFTAVPGPGYTEWEAAGRPGGVNVAGLQIGPLDPKDAEGFFAYQWLVTARPVQDPDFGLTSIVILAHNQLAYTKACLDSIRFLTDEPIELILVDNGSTDGTDDYFRALAAADDRIRLVLNRDNRGFPAGVNQGMRLAGGQQILLLNNDTVVTTGWLRRLLRALHSDPAVGLVGPCSNHVSGPQEVAAEYDDLAGIDRFAWEYAKTHQGVREETGRLVGFCLLIKLAVLETVGWFDEGFGIGNFEDDDYCLRARRAGFRAVIVRDAFVHHVGGATFAESGVHYEGLMQANRHRFEKKWESIEPTPALERLATRSAKTFRALVLAHVGLFRDRLDRSHFYRYEALSRRPGVTLFGPGLPGYRSGMTLAEAVKFACGDEWPDVVVHGCDPRASGIPLVTGLANAPVPTAIELLDSWAFPDDQVRFVREQRFAMGLMQEAGHHLDYYRQRCPGVEFVWAPNAVNTSLFRDHGLDKEYDVIVYGNLDPGVYPLRARLARLLQRQQEFRVQTIPHPGYYPAPERMPATVSGEGLSRAINRSWLALATCSVYRCLLTKYLEIAASQALVIGDLPESARDTFGDDYLSLSFGDDDEEVLRKIRHTLSDKPALTARTRRVADRVARHFSTDAFAIRVLEALGGLVEKTPVTRSRQLETSTLSPPTAATRGMSFRPADGGGLLLVPPPITLSGCLIVRDNEQTIRPCLESLRPWVDELVVVDTGSKDATPRIAAECGARVFEFPWCDDFSAARNESVRHARGKWVFWMDSDDTIDEVSGRTVRDLADRDPDPRVLGYVVRVHCPGPGQRGHDDMTVVDHVKLFRNRPDLRFEGRIHEQILPAIRRAGGEVAWTDAFVLHSGYDHTPEGQERKKERDLRILHRELAERPDHPFTLFNLGMTYADVGEHPTAIDFLRRCLRHSEPGESHRRKAYALIAFCESRLEKVFEALSVCQEGLAEFPGDLELRFRRGLLLQEGGRLEEAVAAYEDVLANPGERYFASVDRGIGGFKARQNLASVHAERGDWARAEREWRRVTAEAPTYPAGWRGWGESLVRQKKYSEAADLVTRLTAEPSLALEGVLLTARIATARGEVAEAVGLLRTASREAGDPEPLQDLCRLLFEHYGAEAAEPALRELTTRSPGDAAAFHNLGTALAALGKPADAAAAYRKSVELRPKSGDTWARLGDVLRDAGHRTEAEQAWDEARRLGARG